MFLLRFWQDFLSLIFPDLCVSCNSPLSGGTEHLCVKCRYDLPKTNNHNIQIEPLEEKFQNIVAYRHLLVYCYFQKGGKVQKLMHAFKYQNKPQIGKLLAKWYAAELLEEKPELAFDIIIPIPLHPSKQKKRGYNQSEWIAKGVAEVFTCEQTNDVLFRAKANVSLTKLSKVERIKILSNTYLANEENDSMIKGKHVLLVDDVLTTGSTFIACYEVLQKLEPASVSFLALAAAK